MALSLSRRKLLAAASASAFFAPYVHAAEEKTAPIRQGRLRQSVMSSVWGNTRFSFEERCELLSLLGFSGVDLPAPNQLSILQDYGLGAALMTGTGTSFQDGLIRRELHDKIEEATRAGIDMCVAAGCPTLIAMPGERRGMSREEGRDNAIEILRRIAPYAEEKGINVCMEVTNSKVVADARTDQVFDNINWGFDVCRGTGSSRIKVLYDCYHVQIANGDVVRTLRDNLDLVCHIHVAGVPSREEIDANQELNYRYIAQQIADMGYKGYVSHEWRPGAGRNPLLSIATCFDILVV
ncbi:MAG: TIM barrel protein [Pseudomonadales bacterium]|jgi:hydroxypyruvate isomerase|nr:TIM barrel protein [Pseudomonadales bacterium]